MTPHEHFDNILEWQIKLFFCKSNFFAKYYSLNTETAFCNHETLAKKMLFVTLLR